jgi:integrase/recombinase XerD
VNAKKSTLKNYDFVLSRFEDHFGNVELNSLTTDNILAFLLKISEGSKQSTKKLRYSLLSAFFNFIKTSLDPGLQNPCDSPNLRKIFKPQRPIHWKILEKDSVDEIIFRTENPRNRLMLELMARGGMRVGEVLKLTPNDVEDRKILIRDPKSGKGTEVVFIPKKVADRLKEYIFKKQINLHEKIFPITYSAARVIVMKAGRLIGIRLRPHDLRRHAATFASRSGTPLEIVSKIILRHSNLSTTQAYLGKVSDIEAMRWIDSIHG